MKNTLLNIIYYLETRYTKLLRLFNIRKDTTVIPKGMYCYVYDDEKNENKEPFSYWIKTCKYYRSNDNGGIACTYVGFYGFDFCLYDQCKICGKNETWNDECDKYDNTIDYFNDVKTWFNVDAGIKLMSNHPIIKTNKWLEFIRFKNIDYIDISGVIVGYNTLHALLDYLLLTNTIKLNSIMFRDFRREYSLNRDEFVEYDTESVYNINNDENIVNVKIDRNNNTIFAVDSKGNSITKDYEQYLLKISSEIENIQLNREDLLIKYKE